MATWLIDSGTLTDIADAIRAKTGSAATIQVSDLATEIANIPTGGTINKTRNITCLAAYNFSAGDRVAISTGFLSIFSDPPSSAVNRLAMNKTKTTLAAAINNSPYITIYDITTSPETKLSNPDTLPTGSASAITFNEAGTLCAVGHSTSPYLTVYDTTTTPWTKLTNPNTLPGGKVLDIAFNKTGTLCLCAHQSSPYMTAYDTTTTPWTKLTNPVNLPINSGSAACFTDDGTKAALAWGAKIFIYDTTTTPWTKTNQISKSSTFSAVKYFNNDTRLIALFGTSPYLLLYDTSTYTEINNILPEDLPNGGTYMKLSEDEQELSIFTTSNQYKSYILDVNGDTFTYRRPYPINYTYDAEWKGTNIYIGRGSSTYMQKYDATNLYATTYNTIDQSTIYKTLGYVKNNMSINDIGPAVEIFY